MSTWSAAEVRAFLDHVAEHRLYAAFLLLITSGIASDLDLEGARLSIVQTFVAVNHHVQTGSPKTAKGRRTVALDAGTVAALQEHWKRQLDERLLMGAGFTDRNLVLAMPAGCPHPKVVQELLGHASIGIALDVYSHVTAGRHAEAPTLVASLVST